MLVGGTRASMRVALAWSASSVDRIQGSGCTRLAELEVVLVRALAIRFFEVVRLVHDIGNGQPLVFESLFQLTSAVHTDRLSVHLGLVHTPSHPIELGLT